ncbi:hypothetical protein ACS38R_005718 [Klebsiella pneumoniae]
MLEHKFKTVRELKDALNECPDDAEIDISELPNNISRHGLTTVFDGKKVLICEYHDYEIINKYRNIFSELSKTEQSRCGCVYEMYQRNLSTAIDGYWGLTLSGTKTHVKQRFLPLTPLLMVSDDLWSPVLPA